MSISKTQRKKLKVLGEKPKAVRNKKGLTLKELGYRIDKDPQSISRVEMGDINPTYLYLLDLCEGLEIDVVEIMKSSE